MFVRYVAFLLFVSLAFCQYTFAKKKPANDHVGKAVYHELKLENQLAHYDPDKLYHVGDYICTPGTEHYAPDCRTSTDWFVKTQSPYAEITLDDGRKAIVPFEGPTPGEIMLEDGTDPMRLYSDEHIRAAVHDPKNHPYLRVHSVMTLSSNPIDIIFREWRGEKQPADGVEMTFHYTITKNKLGEEEIYLGP